MWRWRRVAVARVFALVVRCSVMRLLLYSRVGKNRDTRRGSPAGAGAGRGASHKTFFFSYPLVAPRKANDIYRPVRWRFNLAVWKDVYQANHYFPEKHLSKLLQLCHLYLSILSGV